MVTDLPRTIVELINVRVSQLNGCATCLPTPGAAVSCSCQLPAADWRADAELAVLAKIERR